MGVTLTGWGIKRISFYEGRGQVQEWFSDDGRWVEASGYVKGVTAKPFPPGAKVYAAKPDQIAERVEGTVFRLYRYEEEPQEREKRGRF